MPVQEWKEKWEDAPPGVTTPGLVDSRGRTWSAAGKDVKMQPAEGKATMAEDETALKLLNEEEFVLGQTGFRAWRTMRFLPFIERFDCRWPRASVGGTALDKRLSPGN